MEIIYKKVDEIKEYENNPRNNDEAIVVVANSIKEFGFKVPIIVDKNNTIIAGHTRLKASIYLGFTEVPVIIADDLTPSQVKAFRLADNKVSEVATWDVLKLLDELSDVKDDFLMDDFGFDLDSLFADEKEPEDDDFDFERAMPETPFSKLGDLYILGNHRLLCGDATSSEAVARLVGEEEVDLVLTDPPYNVDYEGTAGKIQNDKQKDSEFFDFLTKSFNNMFSHTKSGGGIYVFHADTEGLNFRNAFINAGYKQASTLIWVKNSFVFGRQDYHWRHEPILYGWKEGSAHYFIDDRTQSTVFEYDKPRSNDLHPTMKPLELIGKLIKNSSKANDVVLDLFGGSGSTLIASEQLDRSCFMMELDEKFVDVIVKRYYNLTGDDTIKVIRDGKEINFKEISESLIF